MWHWDLLGFKNPKPQKSFDLVYPLPIACCTNDLWSITCNPTCTLIGQRSRSWDFILLRQNVLQLTNKNHDLDPASISPPLIFMQNHLQCESTPPWGFLIIFPKWLGMLVQILYAYYTFLSTLDYKFSFNYLQLWQNYAILSATTQFTSYAQNVHHRPKRMLGSRT